MQNVSFLYVKKDSVLYNTRVYLDKIFCPMSWIKFVNSFTALHGKSNYIEKWREDRIRFKYDIRC